MQINRGVSDLVAICSNSRDCPTRRKRKRQREDREKKGGEKKNKRKSVRATTRSSISVTPSRYYARTRDEEKAFLYIKRFCKPFVRISATRLYHEPSFSTVQHLRDRDFFLRRFGFATIRSLCTDHEPRSSRFSRSSRTRCFLPPPTVLDESVSMPYERKCETTTDVSEGWIEYNHIIHGSTCLCNTVEKLLWS